MNFYGKSMLGTAVSMVLMLSVASSHAAAYRMIYQFDSPENGANSGIFPFGDLVADAAGNLYGTTSAGGPGNNGNPAGVVFRLAPPSGGAKNWTYTMLYQIGGEPVGGVLLGPFDANGVPSVLYGTTTEDTSSAGTVFALQNESTTGGDNWEATTLHVFGPKNCSPENFSPNEGCDPETGLTFGSGGLLFGTTMSGGNGDHGTAFSISPMGDVTEYSNTSIFSTDGDGIQPYLGRLVADAKGRLYGATTSGGANGFGTVFRLIFADNRWKRTTLYSFGGGADVGNPQEGVVIARGGLLYGCAEHGTHGKGGVYQLSPPASGSTVWSESVVYNFGDNEQANDPNAGPCGLTIVRSGVLFGVTKTGGQYNGGTFFSVAPPTPGRTAWSEVVLHSFGKTRGGKPVDGANPVSPPLRIGASYYGVTPDGGTNGSGIVYEIRP